MLHGVTVLLVKSMPGLPDGLFSNQKIPIWVNFEFWSALDWKMLIYIL
jgi:hypothetical protein